MNSSKNKNGTLVALTLAGILIGTSSFADLGKVVGQVGLAEGDVRVDSAVVKKGAPVREGSVVEVKTGTATLLLGKGSVFHLASNSKMVVNQFGVTPSGETGELDLKYGRTRALILNQGTEKKDLKIRARAATMGVRGTEIYISAPTQATQPVQFFTLEGKAEVRVGAAPAIPVNQNQGVSTIANAAPPAAGGAAGGGNAGANAGSGGAGGSAATTATAGANAVTVSTVSIAQVKEEIRSSGLQPVESHNPGGRGPSAPPPAASLSDQFGVGSLPPVHLDPVADGMIPTKVTPRICSAINGC